MTSYNPPPLNQPQSEGTTLIITARQQGKIIEKLGDDVGNIVIKLLLTSIQENKAIPSQQSYLKSGLHDAIVSEYGKYKDWIHYLLSNKKANETVYSSCMHTPSYSQHKRGGIRLFPEAMSLCKPLFTEDLIYTTHTKRNTKERAENSGVDTKIERTLSPVNYFQFAAFLSEKYYI